MTTKARGTRLRITMISIIVLSIIAFSAIVAKMQEVALAATSGIALLGGGYQASQGFTKTQFIKANPQKSDLEG